MYSLMLLKGIYHHVSCVSNLYFRKIVKLHDISKSIVVYRDPKSSFGSFLSFPNWWLCWSCQSQFEKYLKKLHRQKHSSMRSYFGSNYICMFQSTSKNTGCSLFEVVYGQNPISPKDLISLPDTHHFSRDAEEWVKVIKKLYESLRQDS